MGESQNLWQRFRRSSLYRSSFFRFGLPFIVTIVGGSFWLRDFTQIRYQFRQTKQVSKEEFDKIMGTSKRRKIDPEKILEEVNRELEDDYQIVRGPRAWEAPEGGVTQKEKIQAAKRKEGGSAA